MNILEPSCRIVFIHTINFIQIIIKRSIHNSCNIFSHHHPIKCIKPIVPTFPTIIRYWNGKLSLIHSMLHFYDQIIVVHFKSCPNVLRTVCSECKCVILSWILIRKQPLWINNNISSLPNFFVLWSFKQYTFAKIICFIYFK